MTTIAATLASSLAAALPGVAREAGERMGFAALLGDVSGIAPGGIPIAFPAAPTAAGPVASLITSGRSAAGAAAEGGTAASGGGAADEETRLETDVSAGSADVVSGLAAFVLVPAAPQAMAALSETVENGDAEIPAAASAAPASLPSPGSYREAVAPAPMRPAPPGPAPMGNDVSPKIPRAAQTGPLEAAPTFSGAKLAAPAESPSPQTAGAVSSAGAQAGALARPAAASAQSADAPPFGGVVFIVGAVAPAVSKGPVQRSSDAAPQTPGVRSSSARDAVDPHGATSPLQTEAGMDAVASLDGEAAAAAAKTAARDAAAAAQDPKTSALAAPTAPKPPATGDAAVEASKEGEAGAPSAAGDAAARPEGADAPSGPREAADDARAEKPPAPAQDRASSPPAQAAASSPAALQNSASSAQQNATAPLAAQAATQVAAQLVSAASARRTRFEVRLDPGELGRVDVRLDIAHDGRLATRLIVDRPETLDLLRQDARDLARQLEQAGFQLGQGGLAFQLRDGRRDMWPAPDPGGASAATPKAAEEPVAAAAEPYRRPARFGAGGVDMTV